MLCLATSVFAYYSSSGLPVNVSLAAQAHYSKEAVINADLMDQHSRKIAAKDFTEKLLLVNFFFTTCSSACPIQTKVLKNVHESLDKEIDIEFLSVSISPAVDTIKTINDYLKKHNIDASNWRFTRTSFENTRLLTSSFKVGINSPSENIDQPDHRNMAYLFDRNGRMMQQYQLVPGIETRLQDEIKALHQLDISG